MSYSYSTPVTYGPQSQTTQYNKKKSAAIPLTIASSVIGGTTGGFIGTKINPYFNKNNEVRDSFARNTYAKYLETASETEQAFYNQCRNVLKEIKSAKNADEVKALLDKNGDVKTLLDTNFVSGISDANLNTNKNAIKTKIETTFQEKYATMKNDISRCWNAETKKWAKPDGISDDMYNAIEKTAKKTKWFNVGKGAGIGAVALGLLSLITYLACKHQKNSAQ